jgi:hypothetical protein
LRRRADSSSPRPGCPPTSPVLVADRRTGQGPGVAPDRRIIAARICSSLG